ncbi:MAG: hypothetical protein QM766_00910 [Burkholderiaceae bacterium]
MLELLIQVVGEFLVQVIGQALLELGLHSLVEPFHRPSNPWLAAIGYALFGAIFGSLSLLVFPIYLVSSTPMRIANLFVTPLAVGGVMAAMGRWRARRGDQRFRIDRFSYGFLFAFSFALVRFEFAK